jgi:hypothetical protein
MYAQRYSVSLTTASDGTATGYTPPVNGRILAVIYQKTDFANGVDFTITLEATGEPILTLTDQNASGTFYPRVPVQDAAGADATLDGTRKMREPVRAADDRVKIVIAQGGSVKTGTVLVVVG